MTGTSTTSGPSDTNAATGTSTTDNAPGAPDTGGPAEVAGTGGPAGVAGASGAGGPAGVSGASGASDTSAVSGSGVVVLRPVTAGDLDLFEGEFATQDGTGAFQWFGFTPAHRLRARHERDGLLGPDGGVLTVTVAGAVAGRVEWFASAWGRPDTSTCWTLAIGLFPAARGRGTGTLAQRLLARYLFAHTRAERIQAWTDQANLAEQRALARAGFTREGVLRSAQWRGGRWHDQVLYSLLRSDLPPAD
ncbi:GNAT family N-acetyltransferase [Streptomyces sp. NPDC086783]|uniref:GNAT family N-acetyltransferase n=1 Tax=Streptomyces sp. NPDC086783 TaxID=3365758 RepID=UPI0037FD6145